MIEIIKNEELIDIYKQWADEDPIFNKAAEYLEKGYIKDSNLNWNVKCRDQIRQLRSNGESFEKIHSRVKKHISIESIKSQLYVSGLAEWTARTVYYQLKK